jgi:ABC-type antimicrobial peptide transport system permease subunit
LRTRFALTFAWLAFAISALTLALMGIYGMVSFTAARRTSEMGIRLALGATSGQLVRMIVRQGMAPVVMGLVSGLVCALLTSRFIASQLFGIAPNDIGTIGCLASFVMAAAIIACWIPARRATKIDPLTALRFE